MALPSTRMEFRIALANVDRGLEVTQPVIVARHPSETLEHVCLRVLSWCLFHEERLEFGPGLSTPNTLDLWTRDLTGRLTTWIECGSAGAEEIVKVMQHNADAQAQVVFSDPRRRDEFLAEVAGWKQPKKGLDRVTVWTVAPELVAGLARRDDRRQQWSVTLSGDHFYVDVEGETVDGAVSSLRPMALREP